MEHEQRARDLIRQMYAVFNKDGADWSMREDIEEEVVKLLTSDRQQVERDTIERCATVAEGPGGYDFDNNDQLQRRIAQAIRALGQEDQ